MRRIIFAAALAIAASSAWPQDGEPTETIIVTATRTEIPLADAVVPVEVITRDDIDLSLASDLAELLRFEAGIDIGRNGGPGQATSVFLRGTESNHTLVLIDGVRMNPGTIGGAAIQNIAPEMIERVEIGAPHQEHALVLGCLERGQRLEGIIEFALGPAAVTFFERRGNRFGPTPRDVHENPLRRRRAARSVYILDPVPALKFEKYSLVVFFNRFQTKPLSAASVL